jgi:hypothetical protein
MSLYINAGPSGFEPETAGFLSYVKSPVLYLAELRAHLTNRLCMGIIYSYTRAPINAKACSVIHKFIGILFSNSEMKKQNVFN